MAAAAGPMPSFIGFVATTVDAAYLVEAAARGLIHCFDAHIPKDQTMRLATSGTVIVYRVEGVSAIRRWRDHKKWTDSRHLRNGFTVYREITREGASDEMSQQELDNEEDHREELFPYLGAHVGRATAKRGGLIKKAISFSLAGQTYNIVTYYTLHDVASNNLVRPRGSPIAPMLVTMNLNQEFWGQPTPPNGQRNRAVVMRDDQNAGMASDYEIWGEAPRVNQAQLAPQMPPAPPIPSAAPMPPAADANAELDADAEIDIDAEFGTDAKLAEDIELAEAAEPAGSAELDTDAELDMDAETIEDADDNEFDTDSESDMDSEAAEAEDDMGAELDMDSDVDMDSEATEGVELDMDEESAEDLSPNLHELSRNLFNAPMQPEPILTTYAEALAARGILLAPDFPLAHAMQGVGATFLQELDSIAQVLVRINRPGYVYSYRDLFGENLRMPSYATAHLPFAPGAEISEVEYLALLDQFVQ